LKWRIRINDPKLILKKLFSNTKNYTSPPVSHQLNFGRNPFFLINENLNCMQICKTILNIAFELFLHPTKEKK